MLSFIDGLGCRSTSRINHPKALVGQASIAVALPGLGMGKRFLAFLWPESGFTLILALILLG